MTDYIKHKNQMKNKDTLIKTLITVFIVSVSCLVAVALTGCQQPQKANASSYIECLDGHLYTIVPTQRYELVEKDGCIEGKVDLK